jgi:hypothetical protein
MEIILLFKGTLEACFVMFHKQLYIMSYQKARNSQIAYQQIGYGTAGYFRGHIKSTKSKYGGGHNPKHKLRGLWSYRRQGWEEGSLSGRPGLNRGPPRPDQDWYQIIQAIVPYGKLLSIHYAQAISRL